MNFAKFRVAKLFREILGKNSQNFRENLELFWQNHARLAFICVLFPVKLSSKKIYRYYYLKESGRSYEWRGVRSEGGRDEMLRMGNKRKDLMVEG